MLVHETYLLTPSESAEAALPVAVSAFAALGQGQHRQLHQEVVEGRPIVLKIPEVAGAEVPAMRFLHEAVFLS
jgi:hypothetical protein